jgi:anti-anti-sigma factor
MNAKTPFTAELMTSTVPSAQIWRLSGKMVGGSCCYEFLETVRDNISQDQNHPILDMSAVSLANSTGLGVLASIFNAAKDAGGAMFLVGVNDRIQSVLKVINLWFVISAFDSLDEALAHLAQD